MLSKPLTKPSKKEVFFGFFDRFIHVFEQNWSCFERDFACYCTVEGAGEGAGAGGFAGLGLPIGVVVLVAG